MLADHYCPSDAIKVEMAGIITEDTEFLIECVKKRPALYSKTLKEYSDAGYRKKLWEDVCSEVVCGWRELDQLTRKRIVTEVQRKWLNLRTCFARELKAQKTKTGFAARKRRKYIYYEQLLFLQCCMTERSSESNAQFSEEEDCNSTELSICEDKEISSEREQPAFNGVYKTDIDVRESLLNALLMQQAVDEDKNFALSLVPMLKSLGDDEKLQCKIEILQLLQRIKNSQARGSSPANNLLTTFKQESKSDFSLPSSSTRYSSSS